MEIFIFLVYLYLFLYLYTLKIGNPRWQLFENNDAIPASYDVITIYCIHKRKHFGTYIDTLQVSCRHILNSWSYGRISRNSVNVFGFAAKSFNIYIQLMHFSVILRFINYSFNFLADGVLGLSFTRSSQ